MIPIHVWSDESDLWSGITLLDTSSPDILDVLHHLGVLPLLATNRLNWLDGPHCVNVLTTLEHPYTHGVEYFIMYNCPSNPRHHIFDWVDDLHHAGTLALPDIHKLNSVDVPHCSSAPTHLGCSYTHGVEYFILCNCSNNPKPPHIWLGGCSAPCRYSRTPRHP